MEDFPASLVCMTCKNAGDDLAHQKRPSPHPGPRCTTCHRKKVKETKQRARERRWSSSYGITAEQYQAMYEAQGGKCHICQKATGKTKALAVDHDHTCTEGHDPKQGCPKCVRGLLCSTCNRIVIGRYSAEALRRAADYLDNPPGIP